MLSPEDCFSFNTFLCNDVLDAPKWKIWAEIEQSEAFGQRPNVYCSFSFIFPRNESILSSFLKNKQLQNYYLKILICEEAGN